jgi:BASS family bile acid:Na+ symporter
MSIFDHYADYEYFLAASQLAFAMLGMGALLELSDFLDVFSRPRQLLLGLMLQLIVVPILALMVVSGLPLAAGVAAGLALVAAVPGGTMSNIMTHLGRGNIALSISLTAVTTVGSLLTTPLLLRLLAGTHLPPDFEMPTGRIAFEIAVVLLLPLLAGMLIGGFLPAVRDVFSKWCIRTSFAFIAAMVIGSAGGGRLDASAYGAVGPIAILVFCFAVQLAAWGVTGVTRMAVRDRVAIGIEVTIRNTNLALMVKASLFPAVTGVLDPIGDGMFFVALLYGGVALPLSVIPIAIGRRSARRAGVLREAG